MNDAIVIFANDMWPRLAEYQLFRGEKPGITVVNPIQLPHPVVRQRFREANGFDPLLGIDVPEPSPGAPLRGADALAERVAQAIGARSPRPVVLFDASRESVRLLRVQRVNASP